MLSNVSTEWLIISSYSKVYLSDHYKIYYAKFEATTCKSFKLHLLHHAVIISHSDQDTVTLTRYDP